MTLNKFISVVFFAIMAIVYFPSSSSAQKVVSPKPAPAGSWRMIGTTSVAFKTERDVLWVTGADFFRQLKFKVVNAGIYMERMVVYFENGQYQEVPLRFNIEKGGESRVIDLPGTVRKLKKVEFWYRSKIANFRGEAKLMLFGFK